MSIPDAVVAEVRDRSDIVQVVGEYVALKRSGVNWKGLCPFHTEKTPSFSVSSAKGLWHCHGCGAGGDVITFLVQHTGQSFLDVVADLAKRAGVALDGPATTVSHLPPPVRALPPAPAYPPAETVMELWERCTTPAYDDVQLREQASTRSIDLATVTDRDLARALVGTHALPAWARIGARDWCSTGHRLVVPMYDVAGQIVTLHARRLVDPGDGLPKGLSPSGHALGGTVMADPLGRTLLSTRAAPTWWADRTVVVAEGVPDFLVWGTRYGDSEHSPAVLGVISGSWSAALAARIPTGATVAVRTHDDAAGVRYARDIATSLHPRCHVLVPQVALAAPSTPKRNAK